jgi:uncharacterized protein YjiS (DUF1127 family)
MQITALFRSRSGVTRAPSVLRRLRKALALHHSRRGLGRLDDHLLADIGLTREEAERETSRPVWDVPLHWRG